MNKFSRSSVSHHSRAAVLPTIIWFDIIVDGTCERCSKGLAPAPEETMEALEDEQMRHREAPTDEEIDEMYALAGSDSTEYRHAHD